jgi:hypothetical protein
MSETSHGWVGRPLSGWKQPQVPSNLFQPFAKAIHPKILKGNLTNSQGSINIYKDMQSSALFPVSRAQLHLVKLKTSCKQPFIEQVGVTLGRVNGVSRSSYQGTWR